METQNIKDFLNPEDPSKTNKDTSHFVVLPFPLEKTTSYVQGTSRGPQAILDASAQIEFFDPELEKEALSHGIYTDHAINDLNINLQDTKSVLDQANQIVTKHLQNNKFVLSLGGEHTITPGVAKPFLDKYKEQITVVHIDAHADLKDTFDGSPYSHACAIRRIVDQSPIISIGIRSVDKEEFTFAKENPLISTFYNHDIAQNNNWVQDAIDLIKTPYIYLTVDVDGLDPSIMPATGTPQPGGLKWFETCHLIKGICEKANLIGADVNELCPLPNQHASSFLAAKLCYKIMGYSLL